MFVYIVCDREEGRKERFQVLSLDAVSSFCIKNVIAI